MNSLSEYLHTDWEAMTRADWTGLIIVLVLTALMVVLYTWIFRPSNREKFEQYRDFVNDDEDVKREVGHGQTK
ncbi:MAG: CcoQ/FixQ family Cbb3-type cytochrome c oxidase assembly chaperone [Zetaproteobacteria bacterium CG12_big_fil_rev_8_21_14_0_65_54_13]|nr:MAG: CcoQ/FixQ family Cbb3-type cytochrome c oxidase assembly chaperone [Zetaproteobacteria bacterium CG12_big_fil_rev_8_21_14_0_65_54_13]PIX54573.1 MAG: CcoQ/FixQ family Cbb3-type cytochrome c oxidase assembly chaperone [Zetaproteobacteria bacterium CG_4_10_14_3_um_filter_54_28]PJA29710.1 MAG: CcoQ/FixQ family Cbb3-type cytochrome c oxidase assembly chaperone [Zetaproteobacteria bacterium CG_4_9_14_3_um_filter_54_145]